MKSFPVAGEHSPPVATPFCFFCCIIISFTRSIYLPLRNNLRFGDLLFGFKPIFVVLTIQIRAFFNGVLLLSLNLNCLVISLNSGPPFFAELIIPVDFRGSKSFR
ncbi:unnamed protein product [Brassica oleracea]|uniref:(rape) hypothetical protein n=1 Tax=Brassica napus TaxID=3708 RepID=A0A816K1V0_BRANA|nr:unnamed protein product [Brassica napus]